MMLWLPVMVGEESVLTFNSLFNWENIMGMKLTFIIYMTVYNKEGKSMPWLKHDIENVIISFLELLLYEHNTETREFNYKGGWMKKIQTIVYQREMGQKISLLKTSIW